MLYVKYDDGMEKNKRTRECGTERVVLHRVA